MRKSTITSIFTVMLLTASLSACTGMTTKQRNIAVGAAVGGVAGNVIGGDTGSTLGGGGLGGLGEHGVRQTRREQGDAHDMPPRRRR